MRQLILVFGGLGNPRGSVVSSYHPLFAQLMSRYEVVAIDPLADKIAWDSSDYFPYRACYCSVAECLQAMGDNITIACCFILTPVATHGPVIRSMARVAQAKQALYVVEKPSFTLADCDLEFARTVPDMRRHGARFYFIDTAMVTPSLNAFATRYAHLGLPDKVVALATDNPAQSDKRLAGYRFQHRLDVIERRGLLASAKNGGAGLGLDMGIHALAGLMRFLQLAGLEQAYLSMHTCRLQALLMTQSFRSADAETHLYAQGHIDCEGKTGHLVIEGGKGGDTWDRRLELYYPQCTIVIGFGTLKHPPYLWRRSDKGVEYELFAASEAAYTPHLADILCLLTGGDEDKLHISCRQSEQLMAQSMKQLHRIYHLAGANCAERAGAIEDVAQHKALFLSEQELQIRKVLADFLDNIALV